MVYKTKVEMYSVDGEMWTVDVINREHPVPKEVK